MHSAVFAHFSNHFKGRHADRPVVDDLHFRNIDGWGELDKTVLAWRKLNSRFRIMIASKALVQMESISILLNIFCLRLKMTLCVLF